MHTCVAGVLGRALLGCGPGSTPSSLETKVVSDADVFGVCLVQQVQLLGGGTGVSASDIGEQRNSAVGVRGAPTKPADPLLQTDRQNVQGVNAGHRKLVTVEAVQVRTYVPSEVGSYRAWQPYWPLATTD